jgi:hypothetical protein
MVIPCACRLFLYALRNTNNCIIARLPQAWIDFATSLKHKRQEFVIAGLIGSLDVEHKMRAKDVHGKKTIEGGSSAHVV